MYRYSLLLLMLVSFNTAADYTVCWTPPTENTDNSALTDLAGYNLWAIPATRTYGNPQVFSVAPTEICAQNRGPADCHFEEDGKMCYHKFWPSPEGPWKLKMQAFNTAGVTSANSTEIFFELKDLNGDGNPDVVGGRDPGPVVVPPPDPIEPPPIPEIPPVPEIPPPPDPIEPPPPVEASGSVMTVTRKGYYLILGPDGLSLQKSTGGARQLTTPEEAFEWISKDGRAGVFIILQPNIEVEYE